MKAALMMKRKKGQKPTLFNKINTLDQEKTIKLSTKITQDCKITKGITKNKPKCKSTPLKMKTPRGFLESYVRNIHYSQWQQTKINYEKPYL